MIGSKEIFEEMREIEMQAIEGDVNELSAFLYFKEVEDAAKEAKERIKGLAIQEAEKLSDKIHSGYYVEVSSKSTYDYKHIPDWDKKKKELKAIEEQSKAVERSGATINEETGEVYIPAKKNVSTFLKIKKC